MDPVLLNSVVNVAGLVLVAIIGLFGVWLGQKMNRLQTKTEHIETKTDEIDRTVRVIRVDVDGKLEQILALTARAERAEGRGEARAEVRAEVLEAAALATLAAVPAAVTAALVEAVTPPEAVVKVVVGGEQVE